MTSAPNPNVRIKSGQLITTSIGFMIAFTKPKINAPYDPYFIPPLEMRKRFKEKGWERVVAHQTRNVPHTGHEWLMKGAWFQAYAELPIEKPLVGVLVNAIIGAKRKGDYILC